MAKKRQMDIGTFARLRNAAEDLGRVDRSTHANLEAAAMQLQPLRPVAFDPVPGGPERFATLWASLTARDPGPDDGETWGRIRTTIRHMAEADAHRLGGQVMELYRDAAALRQA